MTANTPAAVLVAVLLFGVAVLPGHAAPDALRGHQAPVRRPSLTAIVALIVAAALVYWTDGAGDIIRLGLGGFAAIRP